eukprot:TRINITY_DN17547_c0_g1_i2.p1 TRINITY_DN17547_c0_g1~~TRINITY_DN17547_c0_g1_i2.p1  ORF type:complete len:966 (-),score=229.67 TRINITY_DN17547_c0_g1_i2:32-2929(-)
MAVGSDDAAGSLLGSRTQLDDLVATGFLALARYSVDSSKQDELDRAGHLFDTALKEDRTLPRAIMGKAVVLAHRGSWAKALPLVREVYARVAETAPKEGTELKCLQKLRFMLATIFHGMKRYGPCQAALRTLVAVDPGDVESLCALAVMESWGGSDENINQSMEYLSQAVKTDQHHPVVQLQLAEQHFLVGLKNLEAEAEGGDSAGTNGSSAASSFDQVERLLQKVLVASRQDQVRAEALYMLARLRHVQERYEEAYAEYCRCRDIMPKYPCCLYGLAQCSVKTGRLQEATAALETIRSSWNSPADWEPEVLRLLGNLYAREGGKAKETQACAQSLLKLDAEDTDAWLLLAEAEDQLLNLAPQSSVAQGRKAGLDAYENVVRRLEASGSDGTPELWNNVATLRGYNGDSSGAKAAYEKGMRLVEEMLSRQNLSVEERKDLQVAHATTRYNLAWLAESTGDHPDHLKATQEYLAITEEHPWYAEAMLGLGNQWQRMGDIDRAVHSYQDSMRENPTLAALSAADAYRQQGNLNRALEEGEIAARRATDKQFHYAHVFLGNLYFEAACSSRLQQERDRNEWHAFHSYLKALKREKDSQFAAQGLGMVFAQRGKIEMARLAFQSVMQHRSMNGEPSVYVNLGHTYLKGEEEGDFRKAVALYEKAKDLKPDDMSVHLYLAKAHFCLGDYEVCRGILSNALAIWPDNMLLHYNLAVVLENFGKSVVTEEKRAKNTQGASLVMKLVDRAVELLTSAIRIFGYLEKRWATVANEERKQMLASYGAPRVWLEEMNNADAHKEYCMFLMEKVQEDKADLARTQEDMERRMKQVAETKDARAAAAKAAEEQQTKFDEDRRIDNEEAAMRLMTGGMHIELGKNLEAKKEKKENNKKKEDMEGRMTQVAEAKDARAATAKAAEAKKEKKEKKKKDKKSKKEKKHKKRRRSDDDGTDEEKKEKKEKKKKEKHYEFELDD